LAIEQAHFRQVREHGGSHGLRDENVLESALARPQQRWKYDPAATIFELAASYAFGLAMNHPYVDGNKRVALVVLVAFLDRNGCELKLRTPGIDVIRPAAAGLTAPAVD
jgi:death-on-curing protein